MHRHHEGPRLMPTTVMSLMKLKFSLSHEGGVNCGGRIGP